MAHIKTVEDISKYSYFKDENLWDYCLEDLDEATLNNEFLVFDKKTRRIYQVTRQDFYGIFKESSIHKQKYICVEDYQTAGFGMFRDYTAKGWIKQANEWLEQDGSTDRYHLSDFKNEQELIDDISEYWSIKIVKLERTDEVINYLENLIKDFDDPEDYINAWAKKMLKELGV